MIRKALALLLLLFSSGLLPLGLTAQTTLWDEFVSESGPAATASLDGYFVIRRDSHLSLDELKEQGWVLVRRLDQNTAIVFRKSGDEPLSLTSNPSVWRANDRWKLSPNLALGLPLSGQATYVIKTRDLSRTRSSLSTIGVEARELGRGMLLVAGLGTEQLQQLVGAPEITYIGMESQLVQEESRVLDMNLNPNAINRLHHDYPDLRGQGMVLSVRENGYNTEDIDLRRRHLSSGLEGESTSNHATEMATIAGGAGNSSLNGRGVAPEVTLTSSFLSSLFPDEDRDYRNLAAWVQNHSYGTAEIEHFYGASAEAYDLSANANPSLLHVFSVGNLGLETPTEGAYAGISNTANLSGNFKMSKNSLAVASVDTVNRTVDFVSRGPAHDGRIKPELTTYSVAGSSNSAAMVAGTTILLQQAYKEQYGGQPASALLKALLINGAEDVATTGPDFVTGYGNMNAYASMEILSRGQFASGTLGQDETVTVDLEIPANAINLKITMVWNDPAANANANLALINDLDMMGTDAANQTWQPWVLDARPESLTLPAVRGEDHLNNVEQITIATPEEGRFTVTIAGFDVPGGNQDYYLVWQWEEADEFDWSFPTGSDNMPYNGETVSYFRWASTLAAATGHLEYSIDNGASWERIATDLRLDQEYFRWDAPDIKSAAMARMVVGAETFVTDQFTISRPERVSIGFSCGDSVRVQWPSVPEAVSYEVLTLEGSGMRQVDSVTDTAFVFTKSAFETRFFSVQPVLADGVKPLRSDTFDYDFQGVGCYLLSFSTEISTEEGIYLNVDLGTIAGISGLEVLREVQEGGFESIQTLEGTEIRSRLRLLDASPAQGLNSYRVRLLFTNGEALLSEISSAYFLTTTPFLVFPNPLQLGEQLNVFSGEFEEGEEVYLRLYDQVGNEAFRIRLSTDRFAFDLSDLPRGIYLYRIASRSGIRQTGRVILN